MHVNQTFTGAAIGIGTAAAAKHLEHREDAGRWVPQYCTADRQPATDPRKLEKIVQVLMDQVERGIDFQGNAYSLFQTAIVLEDKMRERTRTLERRCANWRRPTGR